MCKKEWLYGGMLAGTMYLAFQLYQQRKKHKELEELGECHNSFVHFQEDWNHSTEEQLLSIQDEISTVYSHMDKLLETMEEKPKEKEL